MTKSRLDFHVTIMATRVQDPKVWQELLEAIIRDSFIDKSISAVVTVNIK